ncbi:hypothetical protein M8J77_020314 [Diaphorina citri]|nr:hypothetical protein M8J77_020314 [Diaphorina citri]
MVFAFYRMLQAVRGSYRRLTTGYRGLVRGSYRLKIAYGVTTVCYRLCKGFLPSYRIVQTHYEASGLVRGSYRMVRAWYGPSTISYRLITGHRVEYGAPTV